MQVAGYGDPLRLVDVPSPEPSRGEVRIAVHAAGVNFPDMLLIQGLYQSRPKPPFGPGFEVAGVVDEVGQGVDTVTVGDRVMAFVPHGGYAEEVIAAAQTVFPIPGQISFPQGSVIPIAYGTSYHALVDRAALQEGETLVVLGAAGGVGMTAVELGKRLGATVIACVGADWKAEALRAAGADEVIDYSTESVRDRVLAVTGGRGADVVYDPVGGDATDEALRYLAWKGRLLVIGFTSGRIAEIPANRLLLKGASAIGVFWGQFAEREPEANAANFRAIVQQVAMGNLDPPIQETFPLESAVEAMQLLAERRVVGKVVLEVR